MKVRQTVYGWLADNRLRVVELGILMLILFGVLIRTLYLEQVESGEEHQIAVSRQSIRRIRVPARRGRIFTSDYQLVADNRPVMNLVFYPEEMRTGRRKKSIKYMLDTAEKIAAAIGRPNPLDAVSIERHLNHSPGLPLVVFTELDERETALALECARQQRGVDIETGSVRSYPMRDFAPHIIGFTKHESPREAADRREFFYYIPDIVGRSGVELFCDAPAWAGPELGLRGQPGFSLIQVDHLGYIHHVMVDGEEPHHGNNVVLTIDSRAQKLAEQLIDGRRGAMVVLDADNGDVLAAATAPRYDLSRFSPKLSGDFYEQLRKDPAKPLLNRAFMGTYTPGSILKPLVALALLKSGVEPEDEVDCTGYTQVGDASIRCTAYRRGGHGLTDLEHAIEWSCNGYFIAMGVSVGEEPIFQVLRSAGLGQTTGIGVPEGRGLMPDRESKRSRFGYRWNRYDTALLSMGQGFVMVTPLQAALFTAALGNGGTLWKPNLIRCLTDCDGRTVWERTPQSRGVLDASQEALDQVRKGMLQVVISPTGSGRRGAVPGLTIMGKTGSAEVGSRDNRRLIVWFIAYTEYQGRKYAVAVMVEDGASGGGDCAPLAAEFFREYLHPAPTDKPPAER